MSVNEVSKNRVSPLGELLQVAMTKKGLSMRKLSEQSGICTATISRIINDKQDASIQHLKTFSKYLDISMEDLLTAIGIKVNKEIKKENYYILNMLYDILQPFHIDLSTVIEDISKELIKYEEYAKTTNGKKIIKKDFLKKLYEQDGSGIVIDRLKLLYTRFFEKDISLYEQAKIGSALLYFILSADVIPDYIFPIGYLDDAIAVMLVTEQLQLC